MSDLPSEPLNSERRKFSRINFDAEIQLTQGQLQWPAQLQDVSLKGLLLHNQLPEAIELERPIEVKIILSDQTSLQMTTAIAHRQADQLGLICTSIDLESVSHLRRLLELNLGNTQAAERELAELIHEA
jgi:hypothetical protein